MKFNFLRSKEKTSGQDTIRFLLWGGFLIISFLVLFTTWFYTNFLVSQDIFLDYVPAQSVIYWHISLNKKSNSIWLYDLTERFLLGESSNQAKFLFENVAPETEEIAMAILPGFEDFIFWGRLNTGKFNKLKEKLEISNFSYIFEDDGKITITNTKFGLKEILAVLSQKNFSLADQKTRLIAFNRAYRRFPIQIYISGNFKFGNFYPHKLKSDFWETNQFQVTQKTHESHSIKDYAYLATVNNFYLVKEAENIIKNNLAFVLPETREKKLPDETVVREIIANPEIFVFEKVKVSGEEVRYLKVPAIGEEFFIFQGNGELIASNSRDLLANHLVHEPQRKYYGKNLLDFLLNWVKWVTADYNGIVFGINVDHV